MRRILDITLAGIALVLLTPLLLLIALAIVIDSPGNPLHLGWRTGQNGANFRICKFRTMVPGAAAMGPTITGRDDPRVTRLGRFLRRSKLDELPQFANVLMGDMTLVGPRPETPDVVAHYTPSQRMVLRAKPGLTGCSQVEAGCEEDQIPDASQAKEYYIQNLLPRKLARDLAYLDSRTAFGDLRIAFATAALVWRALFR